mmetsp:Transcript_23432/g.50007  ORF Transcript_23432/g.50007 Transcript_23432/m.50007 type:complete len:269 (+) Transcript_23432:125-931(+)
MVRSVLHVAQGAGRSWAVSRRGGGGCFQSARGSLSQRPLAARKVVARASEEDEGADELYSYGTEKVRSLLKRDSKELKGLEEIGESAETYQPSTSADERVEDPVDDAEGATGKGAAAGGTKAAAAPATPPASPFAAGGAGAKPVQSPFGGSGKGAAAAGAKSKSPFAAGNAGAIGGIGGSGGSGSGKKLGEKSVSSIASQKLMSPFKADAQDMDVQTVTDSGDERPWWQPEITVTQVVLAFSFSLLVVLMVATFSIVLGSGAISFNDK